MKIGVISNIHSNYYALKTVLESLNRKISQKNDLLLKMT